MMRWRTSRRGPPRGPEQARALDQEGRPACDQHRETFGQELTVHVYEDLKSRWLSGKALLVDKSRHEVLADAAEHLLAALKAVIDYAKSRAESLPEEVEASGDAGGFARWLPADAAVTTAQRWSGGHLASRAGACGRVLPSARKRRAWVVRVPGPLYR